ncbi:hypothetical protein HYW83_00640 [Candidatus Peregrinibacteria bacterium]|nr:hypothetical protein [Candidatus Peregrinibacteria bacterium]
MKLKDFRKWMKKAIFTTAEARIVCFTDKPSVLNLQLHQWTKSGDLISLKRGLFMFSDKHATKTEIAKQLYYPCYFSLEYVLNLHGIMPEAVFEYTLVTTKTTRRFETPAGVFAYRKIKREAFAGFDSETLMAEKEKALADYFYLRGDSFKAEDDFWKESRLEATATNMDFKKVFRYAKLFKSKKLEFLLHSFFAYAKSHQTRR